MLQAVSLAQRFAQTACAEQAEATKGLRLEVRHLQSEWVSRSRSNLRALLPAVRGLLAE